jgi:hypothetical protein
VVREGPRARVSIAIPSAVSATAFRNFLLSAVVAVAMKGFQLIVDGFRGAAT